MAEKLVMTALSPTMEEGTIVEWKIEEGEKFSEGDVICEVETDKATMEYEAPFEGTLLKIVAPAGTSLQIGAVIGIAGEVGEDIAELLSSSSDIDSSPVSLSLEEKDEKPDAHDEENISNENSLKTLRIKASPLARKIAQINDVSLENVVGTGPGGRIVKRDIESAAVHAGKAETLEKREGAVLEPADSVVKVSQKRKIIARRISESKYSAPHYYLTVEVQLDKLIEARESLNRRSKDSKVSMNAFLIKMTSEALKRHPEINATWNEEAIIYHGVIDIGLAVAQKDGLITPVFHNCEARGILVINNEMNELIDKARNNKLAPEEYSGATFTISNLGSFGIDEFTAIINPPGSAILAVGRGKKQPVVIDDEIEIRTIMKMTLSCDHRVIDGAVGAAFLDELRSIIEDPVRVLY